MPQVVTNDRLENPSSVSVRSSGWVTSDSDGEDAWTPPSARGTYHIQKKRSSLAKTRERSQNMDLVESGPELAPPTLPPPQIIRPRPGPVVRDPIMTVYG